jgi:hypothetical protein
MSDPGFPIPKHNVYWKDIQPRVQQGRAEVEERLTVFLFYDGGAYPNAVIYWTSLEIKEAQKWLRSVAFARCTEKDCGIRLENGQKLGEYCASHQPKPVPAQPPSPPPGKLLLKPWEDGWPEQQAAATKEQFNPKLRDWLNARDYTAADWPDNVCGKVIWEAEKALGEGRLDDWGWPIYTATNAQQAAGRVHRDKPNQKPVPDSTYCSCPQPKPELKEFDTFSYTLCLGCSKEIK